MWGNWIAQGTPCSYRESVHSVQTATQVKIKPGTLEVWCSILLAVPLQVQGVNYIDPTGSNIKKLDISVKFNGLEESYK